MESNASAAEVAAEWVDLLCGEENPLTKFPEEKVAKLHALAHLHYSKKRYSEALPYYRVLVAARPLEPKFWKGLGACQQMLHDYAGALNGYAIAQLLNADNPDLYVYIHAADCFFALKQRKDGLELLELARKWAQKLNDKRILSHVKVMKRLWAN